jgi:hypothetical protein
LQHIQQIIRRHTAAVNGLPTSRYSFQSRSPRRGRTHSSTVTTSPSTRVLPLTLSTYTSTPSPKRIHHHCGRATRVPLPPSAAIPLSFSLTNPLATTKSTSPNKLIHNTTTTGVSPSLFPPLVAPLNTRSRDIHNDAPVYVPPPLPPPASLLHMPHTFDDDTIRTAHHITPSKSFAGEEHFIEGHSYASPG